ncbi:hypothetical protein [Daejeonella sp.]|uniref:hypothetical protein n=1 Tax=Daejeonella sp. TaxID=2805397 RepID=UPI0030C1C487
MTTSIEKSELCTELQELYLKSKEWISELEFQHDDMIFVKRLYEIDSTLHTQQKQIDDASEMLTWATKIEDEKSRLKTQIIDFMNLLGSLIKIPDPAIDYKLVLWYSKIEIDLHANAEDFRLYKSRVFYGAGEPADKFYAGN